ncbi:tryptophan synthase subunit alpha [Thermosulfuriphilus sp.]
MKGVVRIKRAFEEVRKRKEAALIPFIEAGDPDLSATEELLHALDEAGVDLIELGYPFSDPLADGPTIQAAAQRALRGGLRMEQVLEMLARVIPKIRPPILIMGYLNPFLHFGLEEFARRAEVIGLCGTIIPDLPLEEAGHWRKIAKAHGLANVLLAAPTTGEKRLERLAKNTSGFLYYVSVTGITGARKSLPPDLALKLDLARELSPVPVAVGFGIATADQVAALAPHADGIVVGSAIVRLIAKTPRKTMVEEVFGFVKALKEATYRS